MTGMRILDLGCGAGRDVYIASQLVGAAGSVVGVDMTVQQLDAAREVQSYHADKFGYSNVEFVQGYLEELDTIESLEPGSFDLIVSNCVLNLCTDKLAVLKACHRLLKHGGEFYFSDVYCNRRVPESLRQDPVLYGECLSGALYWNDFQNMAAKASFTDPRLVTDSPITIANPALQQTIATEAGTELQFYSATYRLWKMDDGILEPDCEDYGQAVVYRGTIPRANASWTLDKGHVFESGRAMTVCGNTYNMLYQSPALREHFTFYGDFTKHFGIFEGCGSSMPYETATTTSGGGGGGGSCC
jgi:arsenite methyltransferase